MSYKVAVVLFLVGALVVSELGASQIKVVGQNNNLPTSSSKDKFSFNNENDSLLKDYLEEIEHFLNYLFFGNNYDKTGLSIQQEGDNVVFKGLATVISENTSINSNIDINKLLELLARVIKQIEAIIADINDLFP